VISVLCLTRNAPRLAGSCLESLFRCLPVLLGGGGVEFVLVDDCSEEGAAATLPTLRRFKATVSAAGVACTLLRFRRPMHYTAGLAYALSLARGDDVLFVSHDMVVPPQCVAELLTVAEADSSIGVLRPTSGHMDWAKSFVQAPPMPPRSFEDVADFGGQIRERFGGDATPWPMLIGDAMLIKRAAIDRIGVFDTRFYAYLGDIDYGVRLHRAGFRHAIARGAWLHHEGGGTARESAAAGGPSISDQAGEMLEQVQAAYDLFRKKWGEVILPPHFRHMKRQHFEALHALPPGDGDAFVPPLKLSADVGEIL
jgi:glycosyltransferase involved in cell wall biosynthesis